MSPASALRRAALTASICAAALLSACSEDAPVQTVRAPAPDSFRVAFTTNRGDFVVQVNRAWAPNGADRFWELAGEGFFDENRFYRVLPGFIAQFGANDDRKRNKRWEEKPLPADIRRERNARGTVSFAMLDPSSRTHQVFINLKDNASLDAQGFVPIGRVIEGMAVVDSVYDEYGEDPKYHLIATQGNKYLARMFPKLDYIKTAKILPAPIRPRSR
jgi:peptidyl-prolyl cis-trans isomerase A (cyclophilin A)